MAQFANPFSSEPECTRERILRATYETLTESRYGDTSISRIANQAGISKSVIYHHFDDKESLLLEVLETVLDQLIEEIFGQPDRSPQKELEHFLTHFIPDQRSTNDPAAQSRARLGKTYVYLRVQAISMPLYQEKLAQSEARVKGRLIETIQNGIEREEFRPVDPEQASEHIMTFVAGIIFREMTTESVSSTLLQREAQRMLSDLLC